VWRYPRLVLQFDDRYSTSGTTYLPSLLLVSEHQQRLLSSSLAYSVECLLRSTPAIENCESNFRFGVETGHRAWRPLIAMPPPFMR
jgi:hypothetical protein